LISAGEDYGAFWKQYAAQATVAVYRAYCNVVAPTSCDRISEKVCRT
jgi:hypothetical protein